MKDSQLLSAYADSTQTTSVPPRDALGEGERGNARVKRQTPISAVYVFDACHPGLVLRALVGVAAALAVCSLFAVPRMNEWLLTYPVWVACVIPGLALWLIVCCGAKRLLARWEDHWQWAFGIGLGLVSGLISMLAAQALGAAQGHAAQWIASAGTGALAAAALIAGLVWRAKAQMPAATQARLAELQARIRPHFLFNALNSAISLVRDEPQKAERVLEDLSDVFRQALAQSKAHVSLAEELDVARAYLGVEQIRFGERMRVEWALDADANAARLPPLILQPLVENAVKHGVERQTAPTFIKISTQRRGTRVVVRVTNTLPADGSPQAPSETHGIALANVRDRLALLHDVHASFRAEAQQGFFQARMEFPAP